MAPSAAAQRSRSFLGRVQKTPWCSARKGIVWRLVHDALPLSSRMSGAFARPCACGHALPGRAHHFWDCPCTRPLRDLIQAGLQAAGPDATTVALQRHHIWLGVPPQPSLHPGVWCVVSLAALNAMESTRCTITRLSIDASGGGVLPPEDHLPAIRRQAARAGISRFKMLLADFVAQRRPDAWRAGLPESHPFIAAVPHHPFIRVVAAG